MGWSILLIGKISFILDPYNYTSLIDTLTEHYGVLMPLYIDEPWNFIFNVNRCNVIFYKEESIKAAIDIAISQFNIYYTILDANMFDIPSNYIFPIQKQL